MTAAALRGEKKKRKQRRKELRKRKKKVYTVLQSNRGKLLKFFKLYSKVLLSFHLHIELI